MRYSLFGESHGAYIGIVLEGIPAGILLDTDFIRHEMARRRPCIPSISTSRQENDEPRIVSGVFNGKTTGSPLCMLIENTDIHSENYESNRWLARPGHADYTGYVRYAGFNDYRGGGHFSGRLTAAIVFAGAIAKQILRQKKIFAYAHIREIAGICDASLSMENPEIFSLSGVSLKAFPVLDDERGKEMIEAIEKARMTHDSVGGVIECVVLGIPAGFGGPDKDDTAEGIFARHLFAVPAIKGIEFGSGFALARMKGSESNDAFIPDGKGGVCTQTNHNGGINGGISNGMPLVFSVVIKPTPSIAQTQNTIDLRTHEPAPICIQGRHDPCIVPRAVSVIEAAAALATLELCRL